MELGVWIETDSSVVRGDSVSLYLFSHRGSPSVMDALLRGMNFKRSAGVNAMISLVPRPTDFMSVHGWVLLSPYPVDISSVVVFSLLKPLL